MKKLNHYAQFVSAAAFAALAAFSLTVSPLRAGTPVVTKDWFDEKLADSSKYSAMPDSSEWNIDEGSTFEPGVGIEVESAVTYTPETPSRVNLPATVTTRVRFAVGGELRKIQEGAQMALTAVDDGTGPAYYVYLEDKASATASWSKATGATPAGADTTVEVVSAFDYEAKTVTISVGGATLSVNGATALPFNPTAQQISHLGVYGSGVLGNIAGLDSRAAAASVAGVNYETFAEALAAGTATASSPIVLYADATAALAADATLYVDANGHTFTATTQEGYRVAQDGNAYASTAIHYVAQIGSTKYESLAEALAAAVPTDGTETTITMLAGETIAADAGITIAAGKNIVLDLNGQTVQMTAASADERWLIKNEGTLTVKDSAENGKLLMSATGQASTAVHKSTIKNMGALTVESGTIELTYSGTNKEEPTAIMNDASDRATSLTVKGGTVVNSANRGTGVYLAVNDTNATVFDVQGGRVEGYGAAVRYYFDDRNLTDAKLTFSMSNGTIHGRGMYGIHGMTTSSKDWNGISFDISGGTISCVGLLGRKHVISPLQGAVSISGGTFNGDVYIYGHDLEITDGDFAGSVTLHRTKESLESASISGGQFSSGLTIAETTADNTTNPYYNAKFITGGIYGTAPEARNVVDEYAVVDNTDSSTQGDYPKTIGGAAASVTAEGNTTYYATLSDAITAANASDVTEITILDGSTESPDVAWKVADGKLVRKVYVAQIGSTKYESLAEALAAAASAPTASTVEVLVDEIDCAGWTSVTVGSASPLVTLDGKDVVLKNLSAPLFNKTGSGCKGVVVKNVTVKDAAITTSSYAAAFLPYADSTETAYFENCHIVDSAITSTGTYAGGFVAYAAGYNNQNDGPVFSTVTIKDCSVKNSTITGANSTGGLMGHATGSAWTLVNVEDTEVSGNTIVCTGSSTVKAGALFGTVGAAGQESYGQTGGIVIGGDDTVVSGNTMTSNGASSDRIFGRIGSSGGAVAISGGTYDGTATYADDTYDSSMGKIVISGGAFQTAPSADALADGYAVTGSPNAQGYYTLEDLPPVATVTDANGAFVGGYSILADAVAEATEGATITLLADATDSLVTIPSTVTFDAGGFDYTAYIGSGTSADPYQISNLSTLKAFRDAVNGGNTYSGKSIKLTSDIDLNNEEWEPIGIYSYRTKADGSGQTVSPQKPFCGTFDGDGHTISNLKMTVADGSSKAYQGAGLFGYTTAPAAIKNLNIRNAEVQGRLYVGALVGNAYTGQLIDNCHVSGVIKIEGSWYVGGLCGQGYMNKVTNCSVVGDVGSGSYVRGRSVVDDMYADDSSGYIGGLWGFRGEGGNVIADCTVKNISVQGQWNGTGGICGIAHYGNIISNCMVEAMSVTALEDENNCGLIAGSDLSSAASSAKVLDCTVAEGATASAGTGANQREVTTWVGAANNNGVLTTPANSALVGFDVIYDESGKVTGGTFEKIPDAIIAEGFEAVADSETGLYTLKHYVAQVGDQKFETLAEAIAAANDGETVKMLADVSLDVYVRAQNKKITLDLNGKTVSCGAVTTLLVDGAQLTIDDTSESGEGKVVSTSDNTSYGVVFVQNAGAIIVNAGMIVSDCAARPAIRNANAAGCSIAVAGGAVKNTAGQFAICAQGDADVTITDGAVSAPSWTIMNYGTGDIAVGGGSVSATSGNGAIENRSTGNVIISGEALISASANQAIRNDDAGKVTVMEGTVSAGGNHGIYNAGTGAVEISGGMLSALYYAVNNRSTGPITISGGDINAVKFAILNYSDAEVTISDGNIESVAHAVLNAANGTVTITGGSMLCKPMTGYEGLGEAAIYNGNYWGQTSDPPTTGVINISGGTIRADYRGAIENHTGTLNISGGEISSLNNAIMNFNPGGAVTISGSASIIADDDPNGSGCAIYSSSGNSDSVDITGGKISGLLGLGSGTYSITGGIFSDSPTKGVAEGYSVVDNPDTATKEAYPYTILSDYDAQIVRNGAVVQKGTLAEMVAAAESGDTVTLLADCSGAGIVVPQGKFAASGLTVDFGGFTYTVDSDPLAGSTGTKTQAFQLLKDNTITFKNGTIVADNVNVKMLIQNYSNLTLDNMTLDATQGGNAVGYVLSTNNGQTTIRDTTIVAKAGGIAFDACSGWGGYQSNAVTVAGESAIRGDIEVSYYGQTGTDPASLTLAGGTHTGSLVMEQGADDCTVTKADAFEQTAPAGYEWKDNANGTSTLVKTYTVLWFADDGSKIDETTVVHGAVPTHADAAKADSGNAFYTFAGWAATQNGEALASLPAATGDASYYAVFTEGAYVAAIGSAKYKTLGDAVEAAQAGDTVTLLADIVGFTGTQHLAGPLVLDGAGHTIAAAPVSTHRDVVDAFTGGTSMLKVDSGAVTLRNLTLDGDATHAYTYLVSADNSSASLTTEAIVLLHGGELTGDASGAVVEAGAGYGAAIHLNNGASLTVKDGFYADTHGAPAAAGETVEKSDGVFPFTGILPEGNSSVLFELASDTDANPTVSIGEDLLLVGMVGAIDTETAQGILDYMQVPSRFVPYTLTLGDGSAYAFTGASPRTWNDIIDYGKEIMVVSTGLGFGGLDTEETPVEVGLLTDTEIPGTFVFEDANFTVNGNGNELTGTIEYTATAGELKNVVLTSDTILDISAEGATVNFGEGVRIAEGEKVTLVIGDLSAGQDLAANVGDLTIDDFALFVRDGETGDLVAVTSENIGDYLPEGYEVAKVVEEDGTTKDLVVAKKKYTIRWLADNGADIDETTVEHGDFPTHADAAKADSGNAFYTFVGWAATQGGAVLAALPAATADATYYAVFTEGTYVASVTVNGVTTKYASFAAAFAAAPADGTAATIKPLDAYAIDGFTTVAGQNITLDMNTKRVNLSTPATIVADSSVTLGGSGMLGNAGNDATVPLVENYGTLTVSGAQVLGKVTTYDGGTATVAAGTQYMTLVGESGSAVNISGSPRFTAGYGQVVAKSGSTFTITGGDMRTDFVVDDGADVAISGGYFKTKVVQDWCADGYAPTLRSALTGASPYGVVRAADAWAKLVNSDGDEFYYTQYMVGTALNNYSSDGDTLVLLQDHAAKSFSINNTGKAVTIDLNGLSLKSMTVWYGDVTVVNGTILQDVDLYPLVEDSGKVSNLTIGTGCTVTDGIVLWPEYDKGTGTGYDANLVVSGTVNNGIFVSGNLHEGNSTITLKNGAVVTDTTGPAIALNGYAIVNVEDGATVTGTTGIEVRAGKLNVAGGTITGTEATASSASQDSGSATSGAGIAIAQHTTGLPIAVSVTGGSVSGAAALYVVNPQGNPASAGSITVAVADGDSTTPIFTGDLTVEDTRADVSISGGFYDEPVPAALCADGYAPTTVPNGNGLYTVAAARTVLWIVDGTTLESTVADGEAAVYPGESAPAKVGYTFSHWTADGAEYDLATPVTGDLTLTATWAIRTYTITWYDEDGATVLGTTTVEYNKKPSFTAPAKASDDPAVYYTASWSPTVAKATADTSYTLVYKTNHRPFKVGDAYFAGSAFKQAYNAAVAGDGVIEMVYDATISATTLDAADSSVFISMNDHTINVGGQITVRYGATVTFATGIVERVFGTGPAVVADGSATKGAGRAIFDYVDVSNVSGYTLAAQNGGAVVVKGESSVVSADSAAIYVPGNAAGLVSTVSVRENAVVTGYTYGIAGNGSKPGVSIRVSGGTVSATKADDSTGIFLPGAGTLTVSGGTVTGRTGIEARAGEVVVSGGTVSGTASTFSATANASGSTVIGAGIAISQHTGDPAVSLTVSGGTVSGVYGVYEKDLENDAVSGIALSIVGGEIAGTEAAVYSADCEAFIPGSHEGLANSAKFSSDATEYCVEGYATLKDAESGEWYVVDASPDKLGKDDIEFAPPLRFTEISFLDDGSLRLSFEGLRVVNGVTGKEVGREGIKGFYVVAKATLDASGKQYKPGTLTALDTETGIGTVVVAASELEGWTQFFAIGVSDTAPESDPVEP